jgi:hypothetical protein
MPTAKGVWKSEEVALVFIDYQKEMFENLKSETVPSRSSSMSGFSCGRPRLLVFR